MRRKLPDITVNGRSFRAPYLRRIPLYPLAPVILRWFSFLTCGQLAKHSFSRRENLELSNKWDIICVEGIDYKGMSGSLRLGKSTLDNGFGQFRTFLSYKLAERGKKLITIDKWFPSSKLCRHCGYVNAAINIRNQGRSMLA